MSLHRTPDRVPTGSFAREGSAALESSRLGAGEAVTEGGTPFAPGVPRPPGGAPSGPSGGPSSRNAAILGGPTGDADAGRPASRELPNVPLHPERGFYQRFGKRWFDAAAAGVALLLLAPLFLVIALAIRVEGAGPTFYCSWRVGRGGRRFRFYKFRSMVVGADTYRDHLLHRNEADGPVFKIASDPRITRVGRFLRRSSLDELPQLWNVLVGDMSLVGPRPPIPDEVLQYEPWQLRRLSVRPGLTCLWQISGRSRIGFDEWMRLDMEYIDRQGLALDLAILIRTIPAVVSGEGAY